MRSSARFGGTRSLAANASRPDLRSGSGRTPPGEDRQPRSELQFELGRKNFVRAAAIAASMGLPPNEIHDIQCEALWQAALERNGPGTRRLARQYGFSDEELEQVLRERAQRLGESSQGKPLAACYDARTGKYLSFEEWVEQARTVPRTPPGLLTAAARWLKYLFGR